jgi:uncharacterized protein (UPF0333 family)
LLLANYWLHRRGQLSLYLSLLLLVLLRRG